MRAGILGAFFADDPERRRRFGRAIAATTHIDERAVEGALYVAELAAEAVRSRAEVDRAHLVERARTVVANRELQQALDRAVDLARSGASPSAAAEVLGNTGFIVHTIGLTTFCFIEYGESPHTAIEAALLAGGDTDSHAAIVGGWTGALHGHDALPARLVERIHDGPFGPSHLRGLAGALAEGGSAPVWSWQLAMLRNLALYPIILGHGVARLVPW